MRIRPIQRDDLNGLIQVASATGVGMTSIPKDPQALEKMIEDSLNSFQKSVKQAKNEYYLFVLEDPEKKTLGGISAIISKTGVVEPVYYYQLKVQKAKESSLPLPKKLKVLHPVARTDGPSEICSLYLRPEYRKEGFGKLLSFSRFLFIAEQRKRFCDTLFAELRGYIDKNNNSPFWNGLGRHFLNLSFEEVNTLLDGRKNCFIEALPSYPLYLWMLSQSTRNAIGKTHPNTRSALKMLHEEGFHTTTFYNTIDAGPIVEAKMDAIKTINESIVATISAVTANSLTTKQFLISNNTLNFRACYGKVKQKRNGQVIISSDVAKALEVGLGDEIRFAPAKLRKT